MAAGAWFRRRGGAPVGAWPARRARVPVSSRLGFHRSPHCPRRTGALQESSRCRAPPTPLPPTSRLRDLPLAAQSTGLHRACRAPGPGHTPSPLHGPGAVQRRRFPARAEAQLLPARRHHLVALPGPGQPRGASQPRPALPVLGAPGPRVSRMGSRGWEATLEPPTLMSLLGGAGPRQRGSRLRLVLRSGGSCSRVPAELGREQPVPRNERRGRRRNGSGSREAVGRGLPQKLVPPRRLGAGVGAVPAPAGGGELRRGPGRCHRRKAAPPDEG